MLSIPSENVNKIIFKKCLCLKTKQNTEMNDEEHPESEFYYPKEQEAAERKAIPWSAF